MLNALLIAVAVAVPPKFVFSGADAEFTGNLQVDGSLDVLNTAGVSTTMNVWPKLDCHYSAFFRYVVSFSRGGASFLDLFGVPGEGMHAATLFDDWDSHNNMIWTTQANLGVMHSETFPEMGINNEDTHSWFVSTDLSAYLVLYASSTDGAAHIGAGDSVVKMDSPLVLPVLSPEGACSGSPSGALFRSNSGAFCYCESGGAVSLVSGGACP